MKRTWIAMLLLPSLHALDPDQPSRVAIEAAAARAVGAHDPDPFTRNPDWLAAPFLSLSELSLIFSHPINRAVDQDPRIAMQDAGVLTLVKLLDVRTRFIDDRLQRAVRSGIGQVVILGAGLDTRAYRFRALLQNAKVFEIDSPGTLELKKRRVQEIFGTPPPNVTYVALDLDRAELSSVGFRNSEKTFFIWEGGCMYHSEARVRDILRSISRAAAGSSLVMDFAGKNAVEQARRDPGSPEERFDGAWGEPWLFGVPEKPEAFFREMGFDPVELMPVDSPVAIRRYLTHRDQSVVGQGQESANSVAITIAELAVATAP